MGGRIGSPRLTKDGEDGLVNPLCSQSAHAQKVLPRCAQLGINQAALVNLKSQLNFLAHPFHPSRYS